MLKMAFTSYSYSWKIRYVVAVAVILATIFMGVLFGFYDYKQQRRELGEEMLTLTSVIAQRSSAAVSFLDHKRATENLTGTLLTGKVIYACMTNTTYAEPVLLSELSHPAYRCNEQLAAGELYAYIDNVLVLEQAVTLNGLQVGFLKMIVSTDQLSERMLRLWATLAMSAIGAVVLAFGLTRRYQQQLIQPVVDLGRVAEVITRDRDYGVRARKYANDEIGATVDAFNTMLQMHEDDKTKLERMAYYDTLTGLPNRRLFMERLAHAIAHSASANKFYGVIFIDLDNFKWVNDTLGHDMGDLLLKVIAKRASSAVRDVDMVARLGGDEFTVVLMELNNIGEAEQACQRILDSLSPTIQLRDHAHKAGASLGLAISKGLEDTVDSIIKKADLAVYDAKNAGKNCYRVYQGEGVVDETTNS